MKIDKTYGSPTCRGYAKLMGVNIVGKLKMRWEKYGVDRMRKVYIDEVGTKYYPSPDHPTLVLPDGTIK